MARHDDTNEFDDDDGPIQPDDVTSGHDGSLDQLAQRAVDSVLHLARRANALAGGVMMFVILCSIGGFALGVAALSGALQTVWILIGGFFAVIAIGAVIRAMLRLRAVRRTAGKLFTEIRVLISGDVHLEQTVDATVRSAESKSDDGITDLSREFVSFQGAIGNRTGEFYALTSALATVTTFPALMAIAALIAFVFVGFGMIFGAVLLL